jgi:pyridoxamine 5'-phosphate oxidase
VRLFLRGYLEENLKQLEVDYDSVVIPRPKHWGGFSRSCRN